MLLDKVYSAWQDMIEVKKSYAENRKIHPEVYSMYAAMASKTKSDNEPLYLNGQAFAIIETNNKFAKYFLDIRIARGVRIYCPLRTKQTIEGSINDSKLIKRDGHYELHLSISKEVEINTHPSAILAVDMAKENNTVILLGDLSGIRNKKRGKRLNRIVANMPFYKLTHYITYKANWEGIPVVMTKEWYTSKLCHNCGSDNTSRPHQGLFMCHACGYSCNADYNGAVNLGNRLWNQMFHDGVIGFSALERDDFLDSASQTKT